MQTITIEELHEHTGEWIRKASGNEEITVTDGGRPVVRLMPLAAGSQTVENPWRNRVLLPGFAELQKRMVGGIDSTQIISEDRDGR
jgi:prevent-host-death family protein